jgi:predicted transcriptional regulator
MSDGDRIRINWAGVLGQLAMVGLSQNDIAALLGRSQSTVSDWSRGVEPRYSDGEALLKLLRESVSENRLDTQAIMVAYP